MIATRSIRRRPNGRASCQCCYRQTRNRRGAAAVEAALLTPLLVIVTLGAIDIAQYIHTAQTISNASRVAARHACRNGTISTSEVRTTATNYIANAYPHLSADELSAAITIQVNDADGDAIVDGNLTQISSGDKFSVSVALNFDSVRWLGAIDYWNLSLEPYVSHVRRE